MKHRQILNIIILHAVDATADITWGERIFTVLFHFWVTLVNPHELILFNAVHTNTFMHKYIQSKYIKHFLPGHVCAPGPCLTLVVVAVDPSQTKHKKVI